METRDFLGREEDEESDKNEAATAPRQRTGEERDELQKSMGGLQHSRQSMSCILMGCTLKLSKTEERSIWKDQLEVVPPMHTAGHSAHVTNHNGDNITH